MQYHFRFEDWLTFLGIFNATVQFIFSLKDNQCNFYSEKQKFNAIKFQVFVSSISLLNQNRRKATLVPLMFIIKVKKIFLI